jgi:hypothetical protein
MTAAGENLTDTDDEMPGEETEGRARSCKPEGWAPHRYAQRNDAMCQKETTRLKPSAPACTMP